MGTKRYNLMGKNNGNPSTRFAQGGGFALV